MRDLYKTFLKQGILPSEVDKQDLGILLWVCLSQANDQEQDEYSADAPIFGLL